jgi:hypothetical protein
MSKPVSKESVLRVRVESRFMRELDKHVDAVNRERPLNPVDRSYIVREAIMEFLNRSPKAA